ncbi:zinc finger BED domain-containing protein 4-like [Aphis craccivora]|uniref:Zinc finger BED domain-containing protein 4-like n=1 Tax=Aphis craccivora TaxID=307492 RepID=A0A6G0VWP5_APHCR|nr:zinc finger BED domain-containing protein 4-like [Aphis craccivora]
MLLRFTQPINCTLCCSHNHLVVEKGIEKTQEIDKETKVKSGGVLVLVSKRSSKASDLLRKYQNIEGKKEGQYLKLILDIRTGWNSMYYMIEKFLKLTNNVSQMLLILNVN